MAAALLTEIPRSILGEKSACCIRNDVDDIVPVSNPGPVRQRLSACTKL